MRSTTASSSWPGWTTWPTSTVFFVTRPADGRADRRVLEIQLGLGQVGEGLVQSTAGGVDLRLAHADLLALAERAGQRRAGLVDAPRGLDQGRHLTLHRGRRLLCLAIRLAQAVARRVGCRPGALERGLRVVHVLPRDQLSAEELDQPVAIEASPLEVRGGRADARVRGGDGGLLGAEVAPTLLEIVSGHLGALLDRGERGRRLRRCAARGVVGQGDVERGVPEVGAGSLRGRSRFGQGDLEVACVKAHQEVAGLDLLVVVDQHLADVAGDPRADRGDARP